MMTIMIIMTFVNQFSIIQLLENYFKFFTWWIYTLILYFCLLCKTKTCSHLHEVCYSLVTPTPDVIKRKRGRTVINCRFVLVIWFMILKLVTGLYKWKNYNFSNTASSLLSTHTAAIWNISLGFNYFNWLAMFTRSKKPFSLINSSNQFNNWQLMKHTRSNSIPRIFVPCVNVTYIQ